eukprot:TRINITY_DN18568_c0_g1_i5.p1 TRINITY_DN18568_c0_g1~~TRINITY_DN18568_c0_g1_i5.p1  ORF type:complete len:294 (+),score=65.34 TRINITY_DN18568_c0_g1_i5:85-966(+)
MCIRDSIVIVNDSDCELHLQGSQVDPSWAAAPAQQISANEKVAIGTVSDEMFSGVEGKIVYAVQPPDRQASCSSVDLEFDTPVMGSNRFSMRGPPYIVLTKKWAREKGDHVELHLQISNLSNQEDFARLRSHELAKHRCRPGNAAPSQPVRRVIPTQPPRSHQQMPSHQHVPVVVGTAVTSPRARERAHPPAPPPPPALKPPEAIPAIAQCCQLTAEILDSMDANFNPNSVDAQLLVELKNRCEAYLKQMPSLIDAVGEDEGLLMDLLVANDNLTSLLARPEIQRLQTNQSAR